MDRIATLEPAARSPDDRLRHPVDKAEGLGRGPVGYGLENDAMDLGRAELLQARDLPIDLGLQRRLALDIHQQCGVGALVAMAPPPLDRRVVAGIAQHVAGAVRLRHALPEHDRKLVQQPLRQPELQQARTGERHDPCAFRRELIAITDLVRDVSEPSPRSCGVVGQAQEQTGRIRQLAHAAKQDGLNLCRLNSVRRPHPRSELAEPVGGFVLRGCGRQSLADGGVGADAGGRAVGIG